MRTVSGWMTFCPEWLTGSKALRTNNALYLWVYLVFFNMLWVVIPLALMYHSWLDIRSNGIAPDYDSRPVRFAGKLESFIHRGGGEGLGPDPISSPSRYNLRSRKDE